MREPESIIDEALRVIETVAPFVEHPYLDTGARKVVELALDAIVSMYSMKVQFEPQVSEMETGVPVAYPHGHTTRTHEKHDASR